MSESEQRLRTAIKQCAQRGFEQFTVSSTRGDSNCPHPVTYHPKDGHGWEEKQVQFDLWSELAAFDEEIDYGDPLIVLARVFESFPDIVERPLILRAAPPGTSLGRGKDL